MAVNTIRNIIVVTLTLCICPSFAHAQSSEPSHPLLENDVFISGGFYFPDKGTKILVNGTTELSEIDFEESLKTSNSESTTAFRLHWRFGEKWSFGAQYWVVSDTATAVLEEDVEWGDVVFREGSSAKAGTGLDVLNLYFGRRFSTSPKHEFGATLGLHWMSIDAYIKGEILAGEGQTEFYRGSVDAKAPLPSLGLWYNYAWSPKWAFFSSVDWLDVTIGDYSGGLWSAKAGVNWAVFEHFGVSAAWKYFNLNLDVDDNSWNGAADLSQSGPLLALTATW